MDIAISIARLRAKTSIAPYRINLTYLWRHGRLPDLDNPTLFTELVQLRKLHDRDRRLPVLADKIRVKSFAADLIGEEWIIPTLWHGTNLPERPAWPLPLIVKSRHGCNQYAVVRSRTGAWSAIRRRANAWVRKLYGYWLDEWLYEAIPREILVEPFIGDGPGLPVDYKFYVFGGRVEYVQVHLDRASDHRWIVFDRAWRRVSATSSDADPRQPENLKRMVVAAEQLGNGFDFVRVDLYEVRGRPWFGEMTFYPGSGLDPFDPVSLDRTMGAHWLRARNGGNSSAPMKA